MSVAFSGFTKKVENKFEILENKIEIQRKALEEKDIKILEVRMKGSMEKSKVTSIPLDKFKCDLCTFSRISDSELKSHIGKKHKETTVSEIKEFPQ